MVLNYVGHEKCPGIKSYENGMLTAADGTKEGSRYTLQMVEWLWDARAQRLIIGTEV